MRAIDPETQRNQNTRRVAALACSQIHPSRAMIKRSILLHHFLFSHPPVSCSTAYHLFTTILFQILEEWKDWKVAGMCHGDWPLVGKADPESSRSACTCAAGCTSAEIFLKERRLTGTRSGKSLEKSGAKTRCREKVRTRGRKERCSVGGGEKGKRERERDRVQERENARKMKKEVLRKRYEGIYRRNGWSFGRT